MALIFIGSGNTLSSAHTSLLLRPVLHWLLPHLTKAGVDGMMFAIRKCGHLTEYAVLGGLVWRAGRASDAGDRRPWQWSDAARGVSLAVVYAASDEWHQSFVPTRQGSAWDVLIDACGATLGLLLLWGLGRWRRRW